MNLTHRESIVATIAYADIFDYALTEKELRLWLIGNTRAITSKQYPKSITSTVINTHAYITFLKRSKITHERSHRFAYAEEKWHTAREIAACLGYIPTISLIGVSGGLAMNNAKKNDDIDFFIIVSPGSLWISRLIIGFILQLMGKRRSVGQKNVKNFICVNMIMTSDAMSLSKKERDLYSAHEVLQMIPVWQREGVYRRFLLSNRWVKNFLPNAWKKKNSECRMMNAELLRVSKIFSILHLAFCILEQPCKYFQLWYMKNHRTTEVISDTTVRFHPADTRVWVKGELRFRLRRYKIPLDKIFYGG